MRGAPRSVWKSRKSINSIASKKSITRIKSQRSFSTKSIKNSQDKADNQFEDQNLEMGGINNNLEMFIVDINVFGKYIRNPEDLNPLCIRLQDYYNANIKNVF